ncbi:phage tail fiber adhesin gp38 [Caudoviricetes sp.]|nr:MAG: tail fiber adhesin [Podoviridae sp. ct2cs2]UOF77560.1 phage tail fiber adhesin gp38 [Caudoviricetes sp.]
MPLLQRTGSMGAKGFGLTSVNTFSFIATISSNTTSYDLASQATSAGWNGIAPIVAFLTINSGVSVSGTGNTTSSALILPSSIPTKSIITLTNNGTIYGAGGSAGYNGQGGYYQEAGNTDGVGYGGDVPNNPYGDSGGYPAINGTNGGAGYTAIYMATDCTFKIYNYGTITGGGGGAGGGGSNNGGGGSGGNGGIALVETGTPTVTLYNQTGAIFGGGGGGGSGWGNRSEGSTEGGSIGNNATITYNGGGNFGSQGSAGRSSTNNSTTLFSGAGTHSL